MKYFKKIASAILASAVVFTTVFVPSGNVSAAGMETKKFFINENSYYGQDKTPYGDMGMSGNELKLNTIQYGGGDWKNKNGNCKEYVKYGIDSSKSDGFVLWYVNSANLTGWGNTDEQNVKLRKSTMLDSENTFAYGGKMWNFGTWGAVTKSVEDIENTGVVMYRISVADTSYLDNAYLFLSNTDGNYVAVELDEFCAKKEAKKGMEINVPISRFANPTKDDLTRGTLDMSKINGAGIMLVNPTSTVDGWIAIDDIYVCDVDKPTKIKADMTDVGKASLEWEASMSDIEGYEIYRNGAKIDAVDESTLTYTDTTCVTGETYEYTVYAYDKYGAKSVTGNKASVYAASVGAPLNLAGASSFPDGLKIKLTWDVPAYGTPASYEIYRDGVSIGTADGSATEYVDTDSLEEGKYYDYYVKAKASDYSMPSNTVNVYASVNGYPENLVSDTTGTDITLNWDMTNSAVSYNVYRNGLKIANVEAPATTYTDADWKYSEMYTYTVTSVNANGEESIMSNEAYAFRNETDKTTATIFADMVDSNFSMSKVGSSSFEVSEDLMSEGKKSLKVKFASGSNVQEGISFAYNTVENLADDRVSGGRIELAVYAPNKEAIENVKIGLECDTDKFDNKIHTARTGVNVSDYVTIYGYWNYITIPVADFPATGVYSYGISDSRYCGFKFDKVKAITIFDDVKHFNLDKTVYFDDIKIANFSAPAISGVTLSDGTTVVNSGDTISTTEGQLNVKFDTGIDTTTLDGNVALTAVSGEGTTSLPVECEYDSATKTVKVKFTAGLEKSTNYSLKFDGVKSDKGATIATAAFEFGTNTDEASASSTMADSEYVNIASQTVTKGLNATVRLALDSNSAKKAAIDGMDVTVSYDKNVVGSPVVKLATSLTGATVTDDKTAGTVTISIPQATAKYIIGSYIADITFDTVGLGSSKITVDGKLHQAAPAKNVTVSNKADAYVVVVNVTSSGSGGSSSGGGSFGGGRGDATTKPAATTTPSNNDGTVNIIGGSAPVFSDSKNVDWATEAIEYLGKNEIINGYEDGSFRPEADVTREEFVAMIIRAFGEIDAEATVDFKDANKDDWYYDALATAAKLEIVSGFDGSFGVGETISREDMCTIACRAADKLKVYLSGAYGTIVFDDDAEISDYAKDSIKKLQNAGIVNGVGDNNFDPNGKVTRAMAAKVIYELTKLK